MTADPRGEVIQSLWIGEALSTVERLALSSFVRHGHAVHLYMYRDVGNLPAGVVPCDAAAVVPEAEIFRHSERAGLGRGSYAGFANWFRYELLRTHGGWWADTDIVCLRPWTFAGEYCFGYQDDTRIINNAVMKAPRGSELVGRLAAFAREPHLGFPWDSAGTRVRRRLAQLWHRRDRSQVRWAQTGPPALTRVVDHLGLADYAQPIECFYPLHYREWELVLTNAPDVRARVRDSYGVHLWNEKLRRAATDKNATFHPDSMIEEWKRQYL